MSKKYLTVKLPTIEGRRLGGFHQALATAEVPGAQVEVSAGFGLGNSEMYVSVNGHRNLTLDCAPLLRAAIDEAIGRWKAKPEGKP